MVTEHPYFQGLVSIFGEWAGLAQGLREARIVRRHPGRMIYLPAIPRAARALHPCRGFYPLGILRVLTSRYNPTQFL